MEKTVDILKELKEKGYTHHVGSNMGVTTFNTITDPQKYPQFAHIFKNFDLDKSQVISHDTDQFKKPHPHYFELYLKKNNLDPKTTRIIFIDDRRKNIKAANALGLEGVRFKNATQLRKDLADKGIDIRRCIMRRCI
jgi:FMN phosphatase YigB (HAD superfamily)